MDPFFKYVMAALTFVTIASVGLAGWQYSRVSDAQSETAATKASLVTKTQELKGVTEDLAVSIQDRKNQVDVLTQERDAAVADAQRVSEDLLAIQKDIADGLDAPSAPLWNRFEKTTSPMRPMAIPPAWVLLVVINGRVTESQTLPSQNACAETAVRIAKEIIAWPEFDEQLKGHVSIICSMASGRTA